SIRALEEAMRTDKQILLATQMNAGDDDPAVDQIYRVGTLASVLQLLKLPDGTVKVLVEGVTRAEITAFGDREDVFEAMATPVADIVGSKVEME
ncbi:LON peptidase substrate-binding domain-containing protein, partial [Mycobacterium tuberculosis]|nr:LON peptidase substrate-binding domain-containing protein [Mycobacterium tuberculosis]